MPIDRITPQTLHKWLAAPDEIAVLDVRDEGIYAHGHLLLAASLPLAALELEAPRRLPRRDVSIVLIDDQPDRAQRAATLLTEGGYSRISLLEGGNTAWAAAGFPLFSGLYVPSKAFGEVVEHVRHTPRITAETLLQWRASKKPHLLVDSRPFEEAQVFSMPGSLSCPGAELLRRVPAAVAPNVPVVVHCAGRTRSIIGAQSLIDAGIPNPVFALENGTMGWYLTGQPLTHASAEWLPARDGRTARARALATMQRAGVALIDAATLARFEQDSTRTLYIFDVRLPEAYRAAHLKGALNAPGGQLIQSTDVYAPVRGARIVLVDDDLVQAPMTAHWLAQMGWDVHVFDLPGNPQPERLVSGDAPRVLLKEPRLTPLLSVSMIQAALHTPDLRGLRLFDCRDSRRYRDGHIPGAQFLIRSDIPRLLDDTDRAHTLVFISDDEYLARFAAADAVAAGFRAKWLDGGYTEWINRTGPVTTSDAHYRSAPVDAWYSPYQLESGMEEAMREYISWETGLLHRLQDEPGIHFKLSPALQAHE
ncbi:MAG: sulfurtransferase [Proteobacteria bacterium]|nr:sulfurtransferase [Pseudomonadota bacterium]